MTTASPSAGEMVAFRYHPGASKPTREIIPIPTPRPDEVLIKVLAGGVCHSDVAQFDPAWSTVQTHSFTMGHEIAGLITALGADAATLAPHLTLGAYVALPCVNACFEPACDVCSIGRDNLCTKFPWHGIGKDGGWAPYVAGRVAAVIPIPADPATIPPAVAAVATDAIATPYHALQHAGVRPGHTVLIIGCGGLGYNAIQIARNCLGAARVIACDVRESSLAAAREVGADPALTPDALAVYLRENPAVRVDVAVDVVGSQATYETAVASVRRAGTVQLVGLAAPRLETVALVAAGKDLTVKSCFGCPKREMAEVFEEIAAGKVRPEVEERPLEACVEAWEDLHHGKLKSRVVLIP